MKVRTGAKSLTFSYYVRLCGRSVTSTPCSGKFSAPGHVVQCSTTPCVHMHTLTMLPRSTDRMYHGAQLAQTGCVNLSKNLYINPVCY